jgi:hypothetical protein
MRQKGFVPILIIIIIALVAIIGSYYFGTKKGIIIPTPTETSSLVTTNAPTQKTPAVKPSTNWKVYLNISAKYSIKYPTDWEVINYGLMDAKPADETTKYVRLNYQPDISKSAVGFDIEETPTVNVPKNINFDEERNVGTELAKCGTTDDGITTFCWLKVANQTKYLVFTISNYKNIDDNKVVNEILSTFQFTQ